MSTYKEIVYMCLDELKSISDDAYYTQDHIIALADKYRAFLLKKNYSDIKNTIPESNYQTICLSLEQTNGIDGNPCSELYLRSKETIPNVLNIGNDRVSSKDFLAGEITFVSKERMKYVGHNSFLKNIIYCTIGPDNKLYLKSSNPQAYYLENVLYSGIFEDAFSAAQMNCNNSNSQCDPLDNTFPLEESLIPLLTESIVKELSGAIYKPEDETNNANDDLSDMMAFIRRNMKSNMQKHIEGE